MPIGLGAFTAIAENNKARLDWTTLSEINNTGFDIERSIDNKNWTKIGFVSSLAENGNSNQKLQYNTYDESPVSGLNAYRLKQIDKAGTVSYSEVRLLNFKDATTNIAIYPNPATDVVHIQTTDWTNILKVSVSDANGRVLLLTNDATNGINLNGFTNGNYFIQIVKKDGSTANFKVIKN